MIKTAETYHVPVLLKESVDGLNIQPGGIYVDVTFGGGGHSREILSRLSEGAHLYSFDQDADAERNVVASPNFTFVCSNFRYLKNWMRYYGVDGLDGLLADLGVSSHHFDDESRGFSFRFDSPLDMRMNKRAGKTAADIVNEYDEAAHCRPLLSLRRAEECTPHRSCPGQGKSSTEDRNHERLHGCRGTALQERA